MRLTRKLKQLFVSNKYKCKNCSSPIPKWIVKEGRFNVCPICGALYPKTKEYIENYFRVIQLSRALEKAKDLIIKAEFESSVREAVAVYESVVKDKSGLSNSFGVDLMARAFFFKINDEGVIIDYPKIQVNNLSTLAEKNEQDGLKLLSMGVMQGVRNIYMHGSASNRIYSALQIVSFVDLLVKEVCGMSLTRR